jgi:hypothetical protein
VKEDNKHQKQEPGTFYTAALLSLTEPGPSVSSIFKPASVTFDAPASKKNSSGLSQGKGGEGFTLG